VTLCNTDRGLLYRAHQFRRALGARPGPEDLRLVERLLTPPQRALFLAMSPRDQRHGVATLRLLCNQAERSPDLAVAALLHDAGKGYIRLHERVLYVLLASFPRLLDRVERQGAQGVRSALYRSRRHAQAGASLAEGAGAGPDAVRLIRLHHTEAAGAELRALQDADRRA